MVIEFAQPKPRIEDWRVKVDGRTIGSIWRCGDGYRVSVTALQCAPTQADAFKLARRQAKRSAPTQADAFKLARRQAKSMTAV